MWSNPKLEDDYVEDITTLESLGTIVTLSKHKDDEIAYVLPSSGGKMGWIRLSCCVRKIDECSTDFLHEVMHVRIIKIMREDWDEGSWFGFSMVVTLLVGIVIGFCALVSMIRSDAKIDSCYTEWHASQESHPGISELNGAYTVKGHIPWRSDVTLGSAPNGNEAHELMKKVCPVEVR